ncbi:MAG: hypothetical protein KJ558_06690 [Gammaproteobacteria bacterium]|nr:hypothetical protein [Gammaproteobacteria bacterium]MBU1654505.1 hypothetical protein [Gammaproteobacteria bacterium]MBU1961323.1 hypothetical protein [Gammaproteobacteria bacterium]
MNSHLLPPLAILLIVGWATAEGRPSRPNEPIEIVKQHSRHAWVRNILIRPKDGGLKVSGEVRHRLYGKGAIPGHVHIEALDARGRVLDSRETRYYRQRKTSSRARFSGLSTWRSKPSAGFA